MTLAAKLIDINSIPEFKLRTPDEIECLVAGMSGDLAVRRSVAGSQAAYAQYINNELICLWGYRWNDYSTRSATMWLLSTDALTAHKTAFARASRKLLALALEDICSITVLVYCNYTEAIKWLEWLGFKRSRTITSNFNEMKKERS